MADWSPTVAFFASTGALQLAFATVLFVKAKRDETTWIIGLIFGINGVLALLRGLNWLFIDDSQVYHAVTRTVYPFEQFTNLLVIWLALTYPKPIGWIARHRIAARWIAAAVSVVFIVPVLVDLAFQPQYKLAATIFEVVHTTTFRFVLEMAFPLLVLRWAFLLPGIKNPAQLRQFKLLFAAFGVRAAHMIGTWGTAHILDASVPAYWREHVGALLPVGIATALVGWLGLGALVAALAHLFWQRTRSPTENQRAIEFVLWFLAFGVLEAGVDLLSLRPLAGDYLSLVIHPLAMLDVLVLRPILVWAAMVRHQFLGGAVRGAASLQGIAFAVSAPAFYGGFLPLVAPANETDPLATITAALIAVAAGGMVALGVRPLAVGAVGGSTSADASVEADYLAAVEDIYRRGAQTTDETEDLDLLRSRLGISTARAKALEEIVEAFWSRMGDIVNWRVGDRVLGRYRIDGVLGHGGMSHAFLCHDELEDAPVVLKRQMNMDEASLSAIHQEGRTLSSLNHPHILRLIRTENLDNESVLVLEYMEGGSLEEKLLGGPLPVEDVKRYAKNLLSALKAAHARGIVHRDIKPSNILFDSVGRCKIADFGIAHQHRVKDTLVVLTAGATRLMGSYRYMAPEQLDLGQTSSRSDLYSLGAVLLDCLRGADNLGAVTESNAVGASNKTGAPKAIHDVPKELQPLLAALLERDPLKRAQSADAALELIP